MLQYSAIDSRRSIFHAKSLNLLILSTGESYIIDKSGATMAAKMIGVVALIAGASATPLDDYVSKPDPNYGWTDTGHRIK